MSVEATANGYVDLAKRVANTKETTPEGGKVNGLYLLIGIAVLALLAVVIFRIPLFRSARRRISRVRRFARRPMRRIRRTFRRFRRPSFRRRRR